MQELAVLFKRDLQKLKVEIESYRDENVMWQTTEGISNSAGNLCLHLLGNLNWFIGAQLANTLYQRNREAEFADKNIPIATLTKQIDDLIPLVENTLNNLSESELRKPFPIEVFGHEMSTKFFLIHLSTHLSYHLGQINYHRRLIDLA